MSEESSTIISIIIASIFLAAILSFFVIAMVLLHRQRQIQNRQKMDQLKEAHEKILLNIENEIQQETLNHVGRELHDNIGQLLSLAKLNFGSQKPEKHSEGKEILNQIIKEVRALSKTLNLDWVESMTIEEFLNQQLQKIQATGFCTTSFESLLVLEEMSKEQKLILIRVIQESLNNSIKHASPSQIDIKTYLDGNLKKILIRDDGNGFDSTKQYTGSGMVNLKKRMETIGGKFELKSKVGSGTEIILTLPN